jgi:hypothetical protein
MPGSGRAEVYFIGAMMILIIVVCVVTVFFFFKTYKKEMAEKEARKAKVKSDMARKGQPE